MLSKIINAEVELKIELKAEYIFKLVTLALISILFIGVSAVADKSEDKQKKEDKQQAVLSQISLIQEADFINNGGLNSYNLTQIGVRSEN